MLMSFPFYNKIKITLDRSQLLYKLCPITIPWQCSKNLNVKLQIPSYARQKDANAHVILPGAHRSARHMRRTFDTCFTLSLIYHLYVLFVWISYQARFGLKISYPAIVFTMVIGLLNCGSFIVHILLLGTSKVFTLSVFLPCACVHVLLPGTRRYYLFQIMIFKPTPNNLYAWWALNLRAHFRNRWAAEWQNWQEK